LTRRYRHIANSPHPQRYNPDGWTRSTPFSRDPENGKSGLDYSPITGQTSHLILPAAMVTIVRAADTVVWGGHNDPSFISSGGEAYKRDLQNAAIHLLDAGHFALEEEIGEIVSLIFVFSQKNVPCDARPSISR
jgi:pimeloyl-ACP methyl ester carboxylesterase